MAALPEQIPVALPVACPPQEVLESPLFLLKRLGEEVKERALAEFERLGFSPYHYGVLALLEEGARDTQGAIADALGLDRSQLVGLLDVLEERGFVVRRRDPNDRRRHLVSLTEDGSRALGELRTTMAGLESDFLSPLDDASRAELRKLLTRLACHHDPRWAARLTGAGSPDEARQV